MKPSRARIEPSTGKPLNAVLAARIRMMPGHREHEVVAGREDVEDGLGQLRHHRRLVVAGRHRLAVGTEPAGGRRSVDVLQAHLVGQHDDAQQHRDRDGAEQQQRGRGVRALRLAERRHAVGDRLDAGQRRTAGRERPRQQEHQGQTGQVPSA